MNEQVSQNPTVALVTGATGAIGGAISRQLAEQPGWSVVVLARDEAKAKQAAAEIRQATGNERVHYLLADVSRKEEVYSLAERWQGPLDVLVNNAATTPRQRRETPGGIELQFATNVLGYFWMVDAFAPHLKRSAPSRVINVASYYAGGLDLSDLEFDRRRYDNNSAYRQSKQANRMLTVAQANRFAGSGVTVNACHPGDVNSSLSNDLGFGGHQTPAQGADTPVWLATSEAGGQHTGQYFEKRQQVTDPFARDSDAIEALYRACRHY